MSAAPRRYDGVSIFLHWAIGLGIIVVALVEILRGELFAKGSAMRETLKVLHDPAGTIIFALILVRLVWRSTHTQPAMPDGTSAWQHFAAKFTHVILSLLMIAIPLVGLAATFARGRPINFWLFQISFPLDTMIDRAGARTLRRVHEYLGWAILAVAFVHAAAALWHHYVRRDDVLIRMLPRRSTTSTAG